MAMKGATTCSQWTQPIVPHSASSSQTLASAIPSPSSKRQSRRCDAGALVSRNVPNLGRSALFGAPLTQLQRSRSCGYTKSSRETLKRACSASLDSFSDEEFSKKIQELALRFQLSDDRGMDSESGFFPEARDNHSSFGNESSRINSCVNFVQNHPRHFRDPELAPMGSRWPEIHRDQPDWPSRDEIIPASIERKANSVELPLSLRIIKRKKQWEDGVREAGESACCSVKKAFSSMVFIIRELQSFTLQMREALYFEDLQGILARVQKEMHASFVWLFQQVFSQTPTLMVYVMILLANFTVHSMACNAAIAAPPPSYAVSTESFSVIDSTEDHSRHQKFDSSSIKSFSVSSSSGNTASVGGNNGGGGNFRPIASGTDGEGSFNRADQYATFLPNGAFKFSSTGTTKEGEAVISEEEVALWNSIVEEASNLQAMLRDEALDHDTVQRFVSPVTAKIESDEYADYFKTELVYQRGLALDPNNSLLLANYAQFLFLVAHDHDRAEEYFKRAIKVEPPDAEALSKYATFLWKARNETWAAEETYLEAINADPGNSYYAGNYAHFLWNTGGEDTCFPLEDDDV